MEEVLDEFVCLLPLTLQVVVLKSRDIGKGLVLIINSDINQSSRSRNTLNLNLGMF